jgi:hypothetical protein
MDAAIASQPIPNSLTPASSTGRICQLVEKFSAAAAGVLT